MADKRFEGTLNEKLAATEFIKVHSWGKIVTYLKRQFDHWTTAKLIEHGYKNFKIAYMPVLMNITPEGINNNVLAKNARVTKQAMSKVIKELIENGYVRTKTDPTDKRSAVVLLTEKGKKFVVDARLCVQELMEDYRKHIGNEEFDRTIQTLLKIIQYNDQKNEGMHLIP